MTSGGAGAAPADSTSAVPDTVYVVPAIVIEAPRVPLRADDVFRRSGFVAAVNLGERAGRVEDLAGVLSQMVGVRVRQYGGLGSFATVSIRGSSANHVDVYLDGVPLGDAWSGMTNLADLPLDGIERITVYRGFTPPQLGGAPIGGAVNLISQKPDGTGTRLRLRESLGSYGTARHVMSLWTGLGPARGFFHGSYMRSDGDFEYVDNIGTPFNPDDDRTVTRANNDFTTWNFLGRVNADLRAGGTMTLGYDGLTRESGVPGIGSLQSSTARQERSRHIGSVRWCSPALLGRRLEAFVDGYSMVTNERFHDAERDLSLTPQDTDNDFHTTGGRARVKTEVRSPVPLVLEGVYEARRETFMPHDNLPQPTEGPERFRMTHQGTLSGDAFFFRKRAVLTASQYFIWQETEFYDPPAYPWFPPSPQGRIGYGEHTPRFGFRLHPRSWMTVKGNWGEYVRQPTMVELFGNTGSVTGNGDLVPETGTNRDIGFTLSRNRLWALRNPFVEVVYLNNNVNDLILFFANSQFAVEPRNITSAHIEGWEVSTSAQWHDRLRFGGNYTYLDSRDTGAIPYYTGNALPARPVHDAALQVKLMGRRASVAYELHRIGANFLDRANLYEVPGRSIHNAWVNVCFFENLLRLTAGGMNLGNDRVYDVAGFALPGRSFYFTLTYQP